ncbi:hypothetical protein [Sorangium sp. So ce426]
MADIEIDATLDEAVARAVPTLRPRRDKGVEIRSLAAAPASVLARKLAVT